MSTGNKRKTTGWLVLLNLFWGAAALIYDYPVITHIPVWSWIFLIICPLYPFLLAGVWWQERLGRSPNLWLVGFAALPSAVFGVLAVVFYPLLLSHQFSWLLIGQILWVEVYALQGWYLLYKIRISPVVQRTVVIFLLASFLIQYTTNSFGYLSLEVVTEGEKLFLAAFALAALGVTVIGGQWIHQPLRTAQTQK